jgi:hypothetical protein
MIPSAASWRASIRRSSRRGSAREWTATIFEKTEGEVIAIDGIAIDGKTLRRSYDSASKKAALHMVSASEDHQQGNLTLGQVKTADKSNEITAIPELLELLDVSGCLVTIDAMGCQKDITEKIVEGGASGYVLGLKGNQGELRRDTEGIFEEARESKGDFCKSVHGDHGRVEVRRCQVLEVAGAGSGRCWKWQARGWSIPKAGRGSGPSAESNPSVT